MIMEKIRLIKWIIIQVFIIRWKKVVQNTYFMKLKIEKNVNFLMKYVFISSISYST